jgi:phospholipase C
MVGGSNAWSGLHAAYDGGLNDHWVIDNSPYSMAYYKRNDISVHFGIAEAFTVADMYQVGQIISYSFCISILLMRS